MQRRVKPSPPREPKGGIIRGPRSRTFAVNIRPSLWDKRLWIGKLKTYVDAQYAEDTLLHYVGKPPFHFKDAVRRYPSLKCIGTVIGIPEELLNREMCSRYSRKIAKGENFLLQRKDFIRQIENVIRRTDFPFLTVIDDDDSYGEEGAPPPEYDEHTAKALQMSSHSCLSGVPATVVPTHVAGCDAVCGSDALPAYVASFGFSTGDSENILRSAEQSLGPVHFSPNDCPTTLPKDEKELWIWDETIEELNKSSATGNFTPNILSNAGEVYQEWLETFPQICNSLPILSQCASPLSKTTRDIVAPVERALTTGVARGNSEDRPSSQVSMITKKQKIGDLKWARPKGQKYLDMR